MNYFTKLIGRLGKAPEAAPASPKASEQKPLAADAPSPAAEA
jgi:hypothetical protein